MFEWMREYKRILVTGPQRSGTHICARMISHDTGYKYVEEGEFDTGDFEKLRYLILTNTEIVVQCPAASVRIHELSCPGVLVVFMGRDLEEIAASQKRIRWSAKVQRKAYHDAIMGLSIAEIKRIFWKGYQADRVDAMAEVDYDELAWHPLWVPKRQREDWKWDQTSN